MLNLEIVVLQIFAIHNKTLKFHSHIKQTANFDSKFMHENFILRFQNFQVLRKFLKIRNLMHNHEFQNFQLFVFQSFHNFPIFRNYQFFEIRLPLEIPAIQKIKTFAFKHFISQIRDNFRYTFFLTPIFKKLFRNLFQQNLQKKQLAVVFVHKSDSAFFYSFTRFCLAADSEIEIRQNLQQVASEPLPHEFVIIHDYHVSGEFQWQN